MKYEWRKKEKKYYLPKTDVSLIEIPEQQFIMVDGVGNPNEEAFAQRIQTLYALSYAIRMMPKKDIHPEGYFEYTVYPLEGYWSSLQDYDSIEDDGLDKSQLTYTIMIQQPSFVTQAVFEHALELAAKKIDPDHKPRLETVSAHMVVQAMHLGSYDTESETFDKMKVFMKDENLVQLNQAYHKEIYIRQDKKDDTKNRTVLRYHVH